jgi:hypothetical protein
MMTMIGSATAAPGVSIAMSAAIQSPLCIIIVSFFMMGMATCHAKQKAPAQRMAYASLVDVSLASVQLIEPNSSSNIAIISSHSSTVIMINSIHSLLV